MTGWIQKQGGIPPAPGSLDALLPFESGSFDHFALTYDINENLTQVKCYRGGNLIITVNLTYDINENLIDVAEA